MTDDTFTDLEREEVKETALDSLQASFGQPIYFSLSLFHLAVSGQGIKT